MRYFFKLTDGEVYNDNEGVDLPDHDAAESEAAKIAVEWLRDNPQTFLEEGALKVVILDQQKQTVATVRVGIQRPDNVLRFRARQPV